MTRAEIKAGIVGLIIAALIIYWWGFAFPQDIADPRCSYPHVCHDVGGQMTEVPAPTPTPYGWHYRCRMDKDGTTIHLKAVEGGPEVEFSCLNCLCSEASK